MAENASAVLTFGALQSNHARQTAAACARLGLPCHLVLTRTVDRHDDHYLSSGNLLLDRLLGATIRHADSPDEATERYRELAAAEQAAGGRLFAIPSGGSNATGVLGYVSAALELAQQARERDVALDRLVVAASTAGTAAGLILGAQLAGLEAIVDAICVYRDAETTAAEIHLLLAETSAKLELPLADDSRWTVTHAYMGPGYGIETPEMLRALELFARSEGILLDPVYTGKAAAALIDRCERSDIAATENVVFVHTGGTPALFAYADSLLPPVGLP